MYSAPSNCYVRHFVTKELRKITMVMFNHVTKQVDKVHMCCIHKDTVIVIE